jgi:hypothetical protein
VGDHDNRAARHEPFVSLRDDQLGAGIERARRLALSQYPAGQAGNRVTDVPVWDRAPRTRGLSGDVDGSCQTARIT